MDVEVKEADLCLRDAPEGVGVDAYQLQQGLLRKPRVERDLQRLQRLHVLLVEPLALRAEAHRPPQPPDRREVQSDDADRFVQGIRPPHPGREGGPHVGGEDLLLAVGLHDRLETDPAAQEESNEPRAFDVLGSEVVSTAADEPERPPLEELLRRLAAPPGQLFEVHHSIRPAVPRYISAMIRGLPRRT